MFTFVPSEKLDMYTDTVFSLYGASPMYWRGRGVGERGKEEERERGGGRRRGGGEREGGRERE